MFKPDNYAFLPGSITFAPGCWGDYLALQRFHYRCGAPATVAKIVSACYQPVSGCAIGQNSAVRVVGVAVLSWPIPNAGARNRYFGWGNLSPSQRAHQANAQVRTISRVIVHPQFRGIGLASELVRLMIERCPVRYVEALAHLGRFHPFFLKAGMTCLDAGDEKRAAYFLIDRLGRAGQSQVAREGRCINEPRP